MDSPTLRQLELALAVGRHGHFGRAAEACHISQPGLSTQVRELERRLGVTLFERTTRGAHPTPSGARLLDQAAAVVREVDALQRLAHDLGGELRGPVRLAAIPTMAPYLLPPTVAELATRWPEAELELEERRSADMVKALEFGEIDLGLLAIPFDTHDLHVEPLLDEPFVLALPDGHPLADDPRPLPLHALAEVDVLLLEDGHCLRDHVTQVCSAAGASSRREIAHAGLSTLTQMVAAGAGTTMLPASALAIEARPGNGIAVRPFEPPAPGRTVALAWRRSDPRGDHYAAAAHFLTARLGSLAALP